MTQEKGVRSELFREKLEKLSNETGCRFEIVYPKLDEALEANRLFADWFDQGCVIARANKGKTVITYDIIGELSAVLESPMGEVLESFKGKFVPVENELVYVGSDKDLKDLSKNEHPSGCSLRFEGHNVVRVSVNNEEVGPIYAQNPSIAKAMLNKDFIDELLESAGGSDVDEAESAEALEKAKESIESDSAEISTKAEKKPVKKGAKKADKKSVSQKPKAESVSEEERFDLLPLDVISNFVKEYDDACVRYKEGDFLKLMEKYKVTGTGLLGAALALAAVESGDAMYTVTRLAVAASSDAAENGENEWRNRSITSLMNSAIKNYLMHLREPDNEEYITDALFALICGAALENTTED